MRLRILIAGRERLRADVSACRLHPLLDELAAQMPAMQQGGRVAVVFESDDVAVLATPYFVS